MADIAVTHENYKALKVAYDKAVADGLEQFVFQGNHLLVTYCKYLLEYMKNCLEDKKLHTVLKMINDNHNDVYRVADLCFGGSIHKLDNYMKHLESEGFWYIEDGITHLSEKGLDYLKNL